jgi:hypothetical protein
MRAAAEAEQHVNGGEDARGGGEQQVDGREDARRRGAEAKQQVDGKENDLSLLILILRKK